MRGDMPEGLRADILERLGEFKFVQRKGWLRQGVCPSCGKKELYTNAERPFVVHCGRLNNCGYEASVRELYPSLFDRWGDRYQPCEANNFNKNAAADAYLNQARGFDLSLIHGCYSQEQYFDSKRNIGSTTVRFPACGSYWERLIDEPSRFGKRKAGFAPGASYKGLWWEPPGVDLVTADEVWITEGIFNAIALLHHGIVAVSAMSCNNYPSVALDALLRKREGKRCTLVWALDNDDAGRSFTRKWVARAKQDDWLCSAAIIPKQGRFNRDWNDLHLLDRHSNDTDRKYLDADALDTYRYHGRLLIAETPTEKAMLMYTHNPSHTSFEFAFGNRLYWFEIDIDKYHKAMERIEKEGGERLGYEEIRERALAESNGLRPIANCYPVPLYYQENKLTDESWYYYRVSFPHDGAPVKNTFTAGQISTASEFKKRLLSIAPGAVYIVAGLRGLT